MDKKFEVPPKAIRELTTPKILIRRLKRLIGEKFILTGKTRTDGSRVRKLVEETLDKFPLPKEAKTNEYEILPPKKKGVPKITREFIDTYVVTTGKSYNLQVWNRMPTSNSLLIKFESSESLKCVDVRYIFIKVDLLKKIISSIIILTPKYIESRFGKFGKPTIKYQLLISSKVRNEILNSEERILFYPDTQKLSYFVTNKYTEPKSDMVKDAEFSNLYSLELIKEIVAKKLIGEKLLSAATKKRGQALERKVLKLLGYDVNEKHNLFGDFPDIPNQLLEVKVQDTQTVDLGKYSPEFEKTIIMKNKITTFDIRYLIALTNPKTEIIEGIVLSPGESLGELFSYVSDKSYKCQRSIPISFFNKYSGKAVFNPM